MLPILRVIPLGGVLLAIAILILALNPPGEPRLTGRMPAASGALIARDQHPEWRQLLMRAAVRRAEELRRLRELPDTPVRAEPAPPAPSAPPAEAAPEIAAVPVERSDAEPDDVTGTVVQAPGAAIPLDVGETSSTELPVMPHEEQPPVIKMPERRKPADESLNSEPAQSKPQSSKHSRRIKRARAAKQQAAVQFNLFEALFGIGTAGVPPAGASQQPSPH